jgi:TrmH family RNA methyltransferase
LYLKPSKGQLKYWAGLGHGKIRRREGRFLAEGDKVVREALRSGREIDAFLFRRDRAASRFPDMAEKTVYELTGAEWKKISQDKESEGIAALMPVPRFRSATDISPERETRLLLLHRVANPANLGAILRSAHWFGIKTVLLSEGSVDLTHPKVIRASMGSVFHLDLIEQVDFMEILPEIRKHYRLFGTVTRGDLPPRPWGNTPSAVLLGNESHGLPEALLSMTDEPWCIPRTGDADSLSLPQAAAVILYEWTKGQEGTGRGHGGRWGK